jgi:hypothetical protein
VVDLVGAASGPRLCGSRLRNPVAPLRIGFSPAPTFTHLGPEPSAVLLTNLRCVGRIGDRPAATAIHVCTRRALHGQKQVCVRVDLSPTMRRHARPGLHTPASGRKRDGCSFSSEAGTSRAASPTKRSRRRSSALRSAQRFQGETVVLSKRGGGGLSLRSARPRAPAGAPTQMWTLGSSSESSSLAAATSWRSSCVSCAVAEGLRPVAAVVGHRSARRERTAG